MPTSTNVREEIMYFKKQKQIDTDNHCPFLRIKETQKER